MSRTEMSVGSLVCARLARRRRRRVGAAALLSIAALVASEPVALSQPLVSAASSGRVSPPVAVVKDLVAAQVTARAQGARVEVEELRSESSTTWVNPDGTLTTDQHGVPIRFRDERGAWRDVDLSLAEASDGSVVARSHRLGLSVAGSGKGARGGVKGSGESDLVGVVEAPGKDKAVRDVVVAWPGALGAPSVEAGRARFAAGAGVDVVVDSRRSGFEVYVVIKDAAALEKLMAGTGGALEVSLPLKMRGLTARVEADRSVSFVDAKGVVASRFTPPQAWDGVIDKASGDPANVIPVGVRVDAKGKGRAVLTLSVDRAWALDAGRVFPITVDPTYASGTSTASFDTYVEKLYPNDEYWSSTTLKVGTPNGGTQVARSFLTFPISAAGITGKQIQSATLKLYNTYSYSCTAKPVYVYSALGSNTATNWNNQPVGVTSYGSASFAKGYTTSCGAAWTSIPVTSMIQMWASSGSSSGGIRLTASETDSYGWKHFASSESSYDPYISYTYNRKPNAASAPSMVAPESNRFTPLTGTAYWFTSSDRPTFTSTATDPDGSGYSITVEVRKMVGDTDTLVASCASPRSLSPYTYTPSGSAASCALPSTGVALANNTLYYARTAVVDDKGLVNGSWSAKTYFYTAFNNPPPPVISCAAPFATNGTWLASAPGVSSVTCTATGAGVGGDYATPGFIEYSVDGAQAVTTKITVSNVPNDSKVTFSVPVANEGAHRITARTIARTNKSSSWVGYDFGWGDAISLFTPTPGTASSGKVSVTAGGPPKGGASAVTGQVQWRVAGDTAGAWTLLGTPTAATAGVGSTNWSGVFDLRQAVREVNATTDTPSRTPVRLDVRVCLAYVGTGTTRCSGGAVPQSVTRLPHAFGNGYPTVEAVVGQVALYTGEVAISDTDVTVPGYTGDISFSRSHVSFAGDGTVDNWPKDSVNGVFGPGFTANFDGANAGAAGMTVIDNTGIDGTIAFMDEEGSPLVFVNPSGNRTYPTTTTTYRPGTTDTVDSHAVLKLTGTGTSTVMTLTEEDGTVTSWKPVSAPVPNQTTWKPTGIAENGITGQTTFGTDAATGRVNRIVAPVPDGMTGTCPTSGPVTTKGCRVMDLTYAATKTATATTDGDIAGQVKGATATMWDPSSSTMKTVEVAAYLYDVKGRLKSVSDPRTNLGTTYTWDGESTRIATVTPSGLAGTTLTYDTAGKLTTITRGAPTTGGSPVVAARYVYDVPTSGTGLPSIADTATALYQRKAPVNGYAVFGPDYTGPVSGTGVDWSYADLSYVDDIGYTVNTANYGAGKWLATSTDYDTDGNTIRTLDPSATTYVSDHPGMTSAQVDTLSNQVIYNDEVKNSAGEVTLPARTRVTDTYGPVRTVTFTDGSTGLARPHTHTDYDEGTPPNGGINPKTNLVWSRPTTITTGASDPTAAPGTADSEVLTTTTNGYTKIDPADGDPWTFGTPSTVTTDGITRTTRLDAQGRTIAVSQPLSNGADAGTTLTTYYTATGTGDCAGKPEWAGLLCATTPAAAPSAGPTLPNSTVTAYTMWLHPATEVETSGTATRTTTTTYDAAERALSTKTTTNAPAGPSTLPGTYTKYRTDNGLIEYTGALNTAGTDAEASGRTSTTYDLWARPVTVTDEAGVSTTTYNAAGQVATITDPKGATTYTYDGAGERRGLLTSMTVTRGAAAGVLTYTADYDADGNITTQHLPGGIVERRSYDEAGQHNGLSYSGTITPVTQTTDPVTGEISWTPGTPIADQPWLAWSTRTDIAGRVRFEATGQGAAFDTSNGVTTLEGVADYVATTGDADTHQREYRYTQGRLTTAIDAAESIDPATGDPTSTCVQRTYTFNSNGNRTQLLSEAHPDGDCTSTAGVITTTTGYAYDNADRATTGAAGAGTYTYDLMGRVTSVPAADSPTGQPITLGYFDDDLPQAVSSNGVSTTFTLDAAGRRATQTSTDPGGTTTTVRRYADGTDNPAWVETTPPGGPTTITRFTGSIAGGLSGTITADGTVDLDIADMRGNTATTITIPATQPETQPAQAITGWATYTEYGTPTNPTSTDTIDGPIGYGWLGSHERSTTPATAGLTLMGVRYYNALRGLFTALDPVAGGNETAFGYPNDPINATDLSGKCFWDACAVEGYVVAVGVATIVSAFAWGLHNLRRSGIRPPSFSGSSRGGARRPFCYRICIPNRRTHTGPYNSPAHRIIESYIWLANKKRVPAKNSDREGHHSNKRGHEKHTKVQGYGGGQRIPRNPNKRNNIL